MSTFGPGDVLTGIQVSVVGAPHHLPAALKAHEFHNKPGDQSTHYPHRVDFKGPDVTFKHK